MRKKFINELFKNIAIEKPDQIHEMKENNRYKGVIVPMISPLKDDFTVDT